METLSWGIKLFGWRSLLAPVLHITGIRSSTRIPFVTNFI